MKAGKFIVKLVVHFSKKSIKKRRKNYPPHIYREFINVPYIDDGCINHTYDVYLANEENRKHICILDIHGGAYVFGEHQDNYPLGDLFLKNGYDVVLLDYAPNDGHKDVKCLLDDLIMNLKHLFNHINDYGLEKDTFVFIGNSAGGHFAMLLSLLFNNPELQELFAYQLPDIKIKACMVNCPVYDFVIAGTVGMKKSAYKYMYGPNYKNIEQYRLLSPRTYIDKWNIPLYVSTCKNDFLLIHSELLHQDFKDNPLLKYTYLNSDKKEVTHVHNVSNLTLPESIKINQEMIEFANNYGK